MDYWQEKAERHLRAANEYRDNFVQIIIFCGVGLSALATKWLLPTMENFATGYWPVVLFSALVAAVAWPVRLNAKMYLSQRHLYEDAAEREVIARTFLALQESVEMKDEDRKLLLGALFRDSTSGLIKDDQPVNIIDSVVGSVLEKPGR